MSVSYFLSQARQARAIAEQMRDPGAKRDMLEIASRYERLADIPVPDIRPTEGLSSEQPEEV